MNVTQAAELVAPEPDGEPGVPRNSWYAWEDGKYTPTIDVIERVAAGAFKVTLGEFFARPTAADVDALVEREGARLRATFAPATKSEAA